MNEQKNYNNRENNPKIKKKELNKAIYLITLLLMISTLLRG